MSSQVPAVESFCCEYAFLSNFYPSVIRFEGVTYPTVEHAFQAQKTLDRSKRIEIAQCGTSGRAKKLGRAVKLRKDWESVKVELMTKIVRLKFESNEELKAMLSATGDATLIEGNTWNDRFWGVCGGEGKNWLGRILMQVRAEFCPTEVPQATKQKHHRGSKTQSV